MRCYLDPKRVRIAKGRSDKNFSNIIGVVLASRAIRLVLWLLANLLFKIRITGAENIPAKGGALLVSNHVSYADSILIGCATPRFIRFLIWQPLYDLKWLKPFCRLLYAIPLPTRSPKESLRALRNARQELEKGSLVCISPKAKWRAHRT
jgi:acyl-[acyl-carrier-protein]-phospholipid O-acyltransferase/long-chain-fatty-acid--[acyl-carrier-protein] ligase